MFVKVVSQFLEPAEDEEAAAAPAAASEPLAEGRRTARD